MKTDNKPIDKTEYAEMVRDSIAPHILSEAASHTFEKHGSPASAWVSAACFALIFAAAIAGGMAAPLRSDASVRKGLTPPLEAA